MNMLPVGATIGILGGGQLGRMLSLAAAELGFDVHIYEPEADCPAGRVSARCVTAAWDDLDALADFASRVDVLTFEFENIPIASLNHVSARKPLRPSVKSLELTKDRLHEKHFINSLGIDTAPFWPVASHAELIRAIEALGKNGILKTREFGYDGKGQIRVTPGTDLQALADELDGQRWIYEGLVDFACEVSVILARTEGGDIAVFDVTRNVHRQGILHTSTVPAQIGEALMGLAVSYATQIAHNLEHIGVLAVEFFVTKHGAIIVNEIAPRVHNSGHWTQDGCNVCQFQQHIRAVAGWPLGDATRHAKQIVMTNLIGEAVNTYPKFAGETGTFLHLYGKRSTREGRKMGHFNQILG